jgi:hypothetical protein
LKFILRGILFAVVGLLLMQTNVFGAPETSDSTNIQEDITFHKHYPAKATIYSAVLPGLGQAYNKKYWKIPFVWGGFVGLGYMVNLYNKGYVNYKKAYYDLNDNNPLTKSYEETNLYKQNDYSDIKSYNEIFINRIDAYRNQRDLYIIITAGFYLFNILDANVNAHLIDFDISEDLTFNFEPVILEPITNSPILGGQITFTF